MSILTLSPNYYPTNPKHLDIGTFPSHLQIHTHTTVLLLLWNMSRTTRVSRYQKGKTRMFKTNLDLLEQEIASGSGICWAYASLHLKFPHNHANIPPLSFFTGWMPFLPPNQQRQSTKGRLYPQITSAYYHSSHPQICTSTFYCERARVHLVCLHCHLTVSLM